MAQVELTARIEKLDKLQDLWLDHFEKLFESGEITSTDMATLAREFARNGLSLDINRLPKSLRDAIPGLPDPTDLEDDDVVGKIA